MVGVKYDMILLICYDRALFRGQKCLAQSRRENLSHVRGNETATEAMDVALLPFTRFKRMSVAIV